MADYNLTNNAADIDQALQDANELLPTSRGYVLWDSNTLVKQTSPYDTTVGSVLLTGAGGLLTQQPEKPDDLFTISVSGWYGYGSTALNKPSSSRGKVLCIPETVDRTALIAIDNIGGIYYANTSTGEPGFGGWIELITTSNANSLPLTANFALNTDNTYSNGTASNRWSEIFAGTGSINTSDGREKGNYRALTDAEMSCGKELSNNIGVYQWLSSLEEKGDDARLHVGMYVQHAISVFESFGLDPMRYGFICYDEWEAKTDEDGNVTQEAGNRYGFRYDQLNQFLIAGLNARIATLEGK